MKLAVISLAQALGGVQALTGAVSFGLSSVDHLSADPESQEKLR